MFDLLMKWLLRMLAALFGLAGIAVLGMSISHGDGGMGMIAGMQGLIAWGFWAWSGSSDRTRKKKDDHRDRIAEETGAFFDTVNSEGAFPECSTSRIVSHPDNPVLMCATARLMEVTTEQARLYLGTRVKLGSLPIYLGQSNPISRTVIREATAGELAITAKSLVFSGDTRSVDVELNKVTALDIALDSVHLAVKGHQKPFIFVVGNGLLWGMLIKNLTQIQVEGRSLPAGVKLAVP